MNSWMILVRLHLHKNEVDLGSLQPLEWGSLWWQFIIIIIITIIIIIIIIITIIIIWRFSLLSQQLLLIAGCFLFSMSGLYLSLRQRNVLILLTTKPSVFFVFFLFLTPSYPLFPTPLLFSSLYCLMDSTFLGMLAVPSKTNL